MSYHNKLTNMIESGDLSLIHVEAVPRSISTALSRALSESDTPTIYVNEPFNRMKHDIEDASARILEAVDQSARPEDLPLTVVSKNMARNISRPIFSELMDISQGIVWSIRDPHVQISSLITRIANDLEFEPGADKLRQEDLTDEQIRKASDFLESGPKSTGFSKTSWFDMGEHYSQLNADVASVVIDGAMLTTDPETVLQNAARRLGLVFSSRMISGWQGQFINANTGYSTTLTDDEHAWTREAVVSTGILPSSTSTIAIDRMPSSLQDHLRNIAMPVYDRMQLSHD